MSREVLEFVIVPPYEQRSALGAAKERFEHYLANRFRGFTFKLGPFAPVGDDGDFQVLPIMNFVGDDGKARMCEKPSTWLLREITAACREFDLNRSFAA